MPFVVLFAGMIALISGIRGTESTLADGTPGLFPLLKGDFSGSGNFLYWLGAIMLIGMVGYVKPLKPISRAFLVLVILSMFLANGVGFWSKLQAAISGATAQAAPLTPTDTAPSTQSTLPGVNLPPLNPGQTVPDPAAIGPI